MSKNPKPGTVPANRIPIYSHQGHMLGHCGKTMTAAGVSRFTGTPGADLVRKSGGKKLEWHGRAPGGFKSAAPAVVNKREPAPDKRNAMGSAKKKPN